MASLDEQRHAQWEAMQEALRRSYFASKETPTPRPSAVALGYDRTRDCTVVAFRDRVGGIAYLRDENAELVPVARGAVGSMGRDAIEQRFAHVDAIFRSLE